MGRTIPTFNMVLQREIERIMHSFAKELSVGDRELLFGILQTATRHTVPCSQAVKLVPMRPIFLACILEQEKQLQSLMEKVNSLASSKK